MSKLKKKKVPSSIYFGREKYFAFAKERIKKPSAGEKKIEIFLTQNNVKFQRERYEMVQGKKRASIRFFDFYLPEYDLYIEYDGEYHSSPIMGEATLNKTVKADVYKAKWCEIHKKHLLRISYRQLNELEMLITKRIDRISPIGKLG